MNALYSARKSLATAIVSIAPAAALLLALAPEARADWPNQNPTKYYQPPDLSSNGYNVLAAKPPAGTGPGPVPLILADDFPCNQTGPITDIHIWASWLGDAATANVPDVPITLGFWSDVPASPGNPASHPGSLLWSQKFFPGGSIPGHYKKVVAKPGWAPSRFWDPDPAPAGQIMGNDYIVWQYNFYPNPQNMFVQQGTAAAPTNYWLSVSAGTNVVAFGWKTAAVHYNDDAVFGHTDGSGINLVGTWQELFDPLQTPARSLDLAFALTTTNQLPPPPPPTPTNKWVQNPDFQTGLDINATSPNAANGLLTLADDFQCLTAGEITNIQLWASFKGDAQPGGQTFVVSIWSDLAKTASGGIGGVTIPFSRPLQRLWTQTYNPGDYTNFPADTGSEQFYDPANPSAGLSPEHLVWLYNFDVPPTNPFCQQGHGTVYWVSVAALSPPAAFLQWGWKTSTNHWQDTGVFGKVDPVTGNLLVGWQPLFNPLPSSVPNPVDFAFRISSGPPGPDCDPAMSGVIEPPDMSTNGLDVWALTNTIVGDDFLCQVRGPINGFTIWGSWLNDVVDTNASFWVKLWTDAPAVTGQIPYSHPGTLVASALFHPPQSDGSLGPRYQYSLFRSNVQETFYNPNLPGNSGLVGKDTQIWRYDFFPFVPSPFIQLGGPFANGRIYWVTISYIPGTVGSAPTVFGWKTSTRHFQDAAVYGTNGINWSPLYDPRNGAALDLAKVIWKFRVTGKNEDIYNLTSSNADGIQIILSGIHLVTWHYDDSPPWSFTSYFTNGSDTVLQWSGRTIPPGGVTHVGYETPGTVLPTVLSMNWLNGTNVIGPIVQQNYHLLGDPTAVELNDFYTGTLMTGNASVEFYATPPQLDQMINGGNRNPLATFQLSDPGPINSGSAAVMLNPQPLPPGAQYELIIVALNDPNDPLGRPGAKDFLLLPLDGGLVPAVQSIGFSGGGLFLHIDSDVGRSYQLQSSDSLVNPNWMDEGSPVPATGADTILTAPVMSGGTQKFYRVMLMP